MAKSLTTKLLDYDEIYIGTSPMMLLHANNRKKNDTVLMINRENEFAGNWGTHDENGVKSEIACHLIENYPWTEAFFNTLNYDGIKIDKSLAYTFKNEKLYPYGSEDSSIRLVYEFIYKYIKSVIKLLLNFALKSKFRRNTLTELKTSFLLSITRYIQNKNEVFHYFPTVGFNNYFLNVKTKLEMNGVKFCDATVTKIEERGSTVYIYTENETTFSCKKLYLTASLELANDPLALSSGVIRKKDNYLHFLITTFSSDVRDNFPKYLHLPQCPVIHRVTKLDGGTLLVQVRVNAITESALIDKLITYTQLFTDEVQETDLYSVTKKIVINSYSYGHVVDKHALGDSIEIIDTIGDIGRLIHEHHKESLLYG
jgi:hypothetical protein